jgi:hypothetical protein
VSEIWLIEWISTPGDVGWGSIYDSKEDAQRMIDSPEWSRFKGLLRPVCYQRKEQS